MKIRVLVDVLVAGRRHEANSTFDASVEEARVLFEYGWAEEVVVEEEAPVKEAKPPKKKATKK